MATDLKTHILKYIEQAGKCYVDDLAALSEAQLVGTHGKSGRSPYDFTYEVVVINRRIAKRLRGEDPGPYARDGWATAPEVFKNKEKCIGEVESSVGEVLAAWSAFPEDSLEAALGPGTALDFGGMCANHLVYHDAQLNYIQSIDGDAEVHWS